LDRRRAIRRYLALWDLAKMARPNSITAAATESETNVNMMTPA